MFFLGVSGVAFDNGTSPPSPLPAKKRDRLSRRGVTLRRKFWVSGVAFNIGTSPPSPILKERGDSPKAVLGLAVLPSKQFGGMPALRSTVIARCV